MLQCCKFLYKMLPEPVSMLAGIVVVKMYTKYVYEIMADCVYTFALGLSITRRMLE